MCIDRKGRAVTAPEYQNHIDTTASETDDGVVSMAISTMSIITQTNAIVLSKLPESSNNLFTICYILKITFNDVDKDSDHVINITKQLNSILFLKEELR